MGGRYLPPIFFGGQLMFRLILLYVRYISFCITNLFKLHKYTMFLRRKTKFGMHSLGKMSRIVDSRIRVEERYGHKATREDLFLQFFLTALKEERERNFKEELELPLLLLLLWYCEPIDVSYSGEE